MTRPSKKLQDSIGVERITPSRARALLINGLLPPEEAGAFRPGNVSVGTIIGMMKKANEVRNRTVTPDTVAKYARDMREKNWLWTGAPIQIDTGGFVRDGQHRLLAVIESGLEQDFAVVRDVDPRAQLVTDIGRPRSAGAQLQLLQIKNAQHLTAIANLVLRWRSGKMLNTHQSSVMEIEHVVNSEPAVTEGLSAANRIRTYVKGAPQSVLGAMFVEASGVDADACGEFFELLTTGANLAAGSPILVLRNRLQGQVGAQVRFRRAGQLWQVVYAWNAWRQGKTNVQMIRIPSNLTSDTFPVVK